MADRTYWCATKEPRELAARLRERIDRYRNSADRMGRRQLWARAARMYYGLDPDGGYRRSHYVNLEGAQGEYLGSRLNLYRPFVKSLLVMTTGSRPSFSCRPIAYDADTSEVQVIGDALLDKTLDNGAEKVGTEAELFSLYLGEGWYLTTWDDAAGEPVGSLPYHDADGNVIGERPVCQGAIRMLSLRPDEVIRDVDVNVGPKDHRWLCATVQRNRWELMAQYPMHEKAIHEAHAYEDRWIFGSSGYLMNTTENVNDDVVTTYELYHRKTLAMPEGLFALMVGDTIVSMGPLPYDELPFDVTMSDRDPGSPWGYCDTWDMMAIQTMVDSSWNQLTTNRENLGTPNLFLFKGTSIEPYNAGGGRLLIGTQPPQVIDMSNGGVESGERMMGLYEKGMQRMSGLSDASLGNAGSNTSGVALAQQQQTSVLFNSPHQFSYGQMMQGALTKVLKIGQRFMPDEQVIHIAGKNRAPQVKRFKGGDLAKIDGVSVELGSAAMRTSGSRHQIAQELLQAKLLGDPRIVEVYLEMIATGRTEPALEGPRAREVQAERLMQGVQEGQPYMVAATMNHQMMIDRLSDVIADPSMDTGKQQVAMQLIQQHAELWMSMSTNPMGISILAATGQNPNPAAQMMAPAPMGPQGGDQPPAEGDGANPGADGAPNQPAPQDAPQPSPSGQAMGPAGQPSLPEGATPTA